MTMSRAGHDNLSPFKIHDFQLSSRQTDNQVCGKVLIAYAEFGSSRQIAFEICDNEKDHQKMNIDSDCFIFEDFEPRKFN